MARCLRPAIPFALLTALLVAACGGGPPSDRPSAGNAGGTTPQIALTTPGGPTMGHEHLPTFQKLVGMTASDLEKAMGVPGFRRRDDPAEIWQYRGTTCVLDIFLYREKDGIKVSYVDVRGLTVAKVTGEDCMLDVLKAPKKDSVTG